MVTAVQREGPAEKAGLAVEDVLIRVDTRTTLRPADVQQVLNEFEPGEAVVLATAGKRTIALSATLAATADRADPGSTWV